MKSLLRSIIPIFVLLFILPRLSVADEIPKLFVQLGHTVTVSSIAFSPDGRYILSGSDDKTMKLWEISTGKEIRTFEGHSERVGSVAFSPDGRYALSGSNDKTMRLWEVSTGKEIRTFEGHAAFVSAVTFSPDGRYALSGSGDKTMRLWGISTGSELRKFGGIFSGHSDIVTSVTFSPDGIYANSGSDDKTMRLWEVSTGKELRKFQGHSEKVSSVAFSPDGKYILSGSYDKTLKLWDVSTGKEIITFKGHSERVISVAFSPDGRYAISGSLDNIQKLWNVSGNELKTFKLNPRAGLLGKVNSMEEDKALLGIANNIASSPDGRYIACTYFGGGNNILIRLFEGSTGEEIRTFKGYLSGVYAVTFSPDGRYALSGSSDKTMRLWDVSTGKELRKFKGHSEMVRAVAFSPDGRYILSGSFDKTLRLWDVSTGEEIRTFKGYLNGVYAVAFSPDGRYALSGSWDKTMRLWEVSTGNELRIFQGHSDQVRSVAFSPDGKYILSGSLDKTLKLWDVSTGKEIRTFKGHSERVTSVAFSPDGRYALSGSWDKTMRLWEVSTGSEIRAFKHSSLLTSLVLSVAVSPDVKYVLSGSYDKTLKLWDISTGKEIRTFRGHSDSVDSAAYSSDGRYIISSGRDGTTRLWDVSTSIEIAQFNGFIDDEWIVITPDGYYNSSLNGHKYLSISIGNNVYGIDQFYDVFYRPDIVTVKLQGDDISGLITLTINDAIKNPPPVIEFTSAPKDTDQPKVKVCYQAKSTGGGIGEVRLFHNGKLIHSDGYYREVAKSTTEKIQLASLNSRAIYDDMRSLIIREKTDSIPITTKSKGDLFEDCREIDTIPGENEVSVAAFNGSNTVQSYMNTINFHSSAKSEDPHLYILAVGIDQYRDRTVNLKYAVKDAKDLEEKLKVQSATLYKPQNIHYMLLTDKEATKTNITGKIDELSRLIKPQDSFILVVAGHGVLLQNQYYMLTHDFDGRASDDSMISSNEIVEMSKKTKSLSQLLIFDTCHAGGVDYIVSGLYDARMSVLAKKMGLHIYASANDKQAAMDGYKGNGLFTYTLLSGLNNKKEADKNNDGAVSLVELGGYSKQATADISKEIGHSQTPLIINFGRDNPIYKLH